MHRVLAGSVRQRNVSVTSVAHCSNCPGGKYQSDAGASACLSCGVGKYGSENRSTASESAQCHSCERGTYQPNTGSIACVPCTSGQHQALAGQITCVQNTKCATGQRIAIRANAASDQTCAICDAGRYSATADATSCMQCPVGKHQRLDGSSFCVQNTKCAAGHRVVIHANVTSDQICAPCAAGTFSNILTRLTALNALPESSGRLGQPFCETCGEGRVRSRECRHHCAISATGVPGGQRVHRTKATPCAPGRYPTRRQVRDVPGELLRAQAQQHVRCMSRDPSGGLRRRRRGTGDGLQLVL